MDQEYELKLLQEKYSALVERVRLLTLDNKKKSSLIDNLLEHAPFGFLMFNHERKVTGCNNKAEEILGVNRSRLIGTSCDTLLNCYVKNGVCPVMKEQRNIPSEEINTKAKQGLSQTLIRSCVLSKEDENNVVLESFINITDKIEAQKRVVESYKMKEDFLARINHEMRTPLNAISGTSELMMIESPDNEQFKKVKQQATTIRESAKKLDDIFNQLFSANRLKQRTTRVHPVKIDLKQFLREIQATIEPVAERNKNAIVFNIPEELGQVETDRKLLSEIILELLRNACKYTSNGTVTLELQEEAYLRNPWLVFKVTDSGRGIDENKLEHIFDEFHQLENPTNRVYGGTGLGLSLSKNFAQLLGGDVTVESKPDSGSCFSLRIPVHYIPR